LLWISFYTYAAELYNDFRHSQAWRGLSRSSNTWPSKHKVSLKKFLNSGNAGYQQIPAINIHWGLGIGTSTTVTETPSLTHLAYNFPYNLILGVSVSIQGLGIGTGVKNRKSLKGFKGLNMESSKTYAEPLYLAWKLRKSHFTVFSNIFMPRSRYPYFPSFCTDTETPVYCLTDLNLQEVFLDKIVGQNTLLFFSLSFFNLKQCPPLNRVNLGQHKSDNNNQMIRVTEVVCVLLKYIGAFNIWCYYPWSF